MEPGTWLTWKSQRNSYWASEIPWWLLGKEPPCNAGHPDSLPESGRSSREGIENPLLCSWASLVAQLVKNPPATRETWVRSLGWEDPLEKGKATHSGVMAWRIPWTVWGRKELDTTERPSLRFSEIQENDLRTPSALWRCQTNPNQLAVASSIAHHGDISSHLGGQHLMTGLWKGHLYLVNPMIGEKQILNFLKLPKGPLYLT